MADGKLYEDYSGLNKTFTYEKGKATLLAKALTERNELVKRIKYLEQLAKDNEELTPFLWTTLEGKVIALHDIEDDHLKNILGHIVRNGGSISLQIKAEALSRGFEIPEEHEMAKAMRYLSRGREIDAEIIEEDD